MDIDILDLSVRAWGLLKRSNIHTIEQLESIDNNDLMNIRNMGEKTFIEIKEKLNKYHIEMNKCELCKDIDRIYEMVCYIPTDNGGAIYVPINFCPKCGSKINI